MSLPNIACWPPITEDPEAPVTRAYAALIDNIRPSQEPGSEQPRARHPVRTRLFLYPRDELSVFPKVLARLEGMTHGPWLFNELSSQIPRIRCLFLESVTNLLSNTCLRGAWYDQFAGNIPLGPRYAPVKLIEGDGMNSWNIRVCATATVAMIVDAFLPMSGGARSCYHVTYGKAEVRQSDTNDPRPPRSTTVRPGPAVGPLSLLRRDVFLFFFRRPVLC